MPRKFSARALVWRRVVRTAGPPVGTILLSCAILSTAMWIRGREQAAKLNVSIAPVVSLGLGDKGDSNQTVPVTHVQTGSTNNTHRGHHTSGVSSPHKPKARTPKKHAGGPTSTKPGPYSQQRSDVGFTPVEGGVVAALTSGTRPSPTEVATVVNEFGTQPTTTWTSGTITGPGGVTLTLPQNTPPTSMLVLPLHQGVLWLQVQPTQVGPTGSLGPAASDTTLWYTPYPTTGTQPLTTNAQQLGVIPTVSTDPAAVHSATPSGNSFVTPPSSWYAPVVTSGSTVANSSTANDSSTSANPTVKPSAAQVYLYPAGLYQTAQGAVIALEARSSSATGTTSVWLYNWNEASAQLAPVASLWNGAGTYSWFAVGTDVLYFGMRTVIPPSATRFSGHQYLYDTTQQTFKPIRLGTWTSDAYTNGNQLIFDERNSTTWASFTPSGQP